MTRPGFAPRRPEHRGRPKGTTAPRGPRAPACAGAWPPLRGPRTLTVVVVVGLLLPALADAAMTTRQGRAHRQLAGLQGRQFPQTLCEAGSYADGNGDCRECTNGVDYTSHLNSLLSCIPCTPCKSDEQEISPCNRTVDRKCWCKPGTFRRNDSPEVCEVCSVSCSDGMVVAKPCTPWSNLKCIHQNSGTQASWEAPVPREPVPASPEPPTVPLHPQGAGGLVWPVAVGCCLLLVVPLMAFLCWKHILPDCGVDPKCTDRVFLRCLRSLRGPGVVDNAHNHILSNRESQSSVVTEQEQTGVIVEPLVKAEHLLEPPGTEESQVRSRQLVPASKADAIENLRLLFDYFAEVVPFHSWNQLMRLMGLTDNEIHVARARAADPRDSLYEMLVVWLKKMGQVASVNMLLAALDKLGERNAKEKIQEYLLHSQEYVYEDGASSAVL
ncbi:tumor necrosis factor receptor superfamily member 10B isoform X2 [Manis pentadactyla]|uniref:tumor necrosis factor receptor superfamily member 10B isoform X2 n=1 Tax=Manis pentadactyla TaxID=143292 RepID=UPI00255CD06A|nr:tumor necrosis factor receptor superfamily member 10B isoform X2 [Manis pentadactyla]